MSSGSPLVGLAVLCSAAVLWDLKWRRIPNWLTFGGSVVAIAVAAGLHGGSGLTASLAGWAVGLGLFIPFFLLGGMGAGDVKLLAAVGAWLGVPGVVWAALYGALCGGVLALFLSVRQGYVLSAFKNIWLLLTHWRVAGLGPVAGVTLADGTGPKLPYAIPIALGAGLALWLR